MIIYNIQPPKIKTAKQEKVLRQTKSKKLLALFTILFFILQFFYVFEFIYPKQAQAAGNTYYVDNTLTDTNVGICTADTTTYNHDNPGQVGTDSAFATIADINDCNSTELPAGSNVYFRKGQTWREQLTVPTSGSAGNPITFGSYGATGEKPIIDSQNTRDNGIQIFAKNYITIDGLHVINGTNSGIFAWKSPGMVISNSTLENNIVFNIGAWTEDNGSLLTDIEITNNIIGTVGSTAIDSQREGIGLAAVSGAKINNNTISTVYTPAIQLWQGTGAPENTGVEIKNNIITNSNGGIYMNNTNNTTVAYNKISNGSGSGVSIQLSSDNVQVYNNIISNLAIGLGGTTWNGIDINGASTNGFAYNNTVYKVCNSSLTVEAGGNGLSPSNGWTIKNNIFSSTDNTGPTPRGIFIENGVASVTFGNNDYNFTGVLGNWKGTNKTSLDSWIATTGETGSIVFDPQFTNVSGSNFTLSASSAAIDAGSNLGSDYDDALLPTSSWPSSITTADQDLRGSGWEIGAYIYPVPQAPTIGTPSDISVSSIHWNFTDTASDETGFRVYDNMDTLATSSATANLTYLDETGLTANTAYSGRYVKAYNDYGESVASAVAATKYTLASAPGSLSGTAGQTTMSLSADNFTNSTAGSSGFLFSNTTNSASSGWTTSNTWSDTGLTCNTSYTYTVQYKNGDGTVTDTASLTKSTTGCPGGGGSPAIWTLPTVPLNGFKITINNGALTTSNRNVILGFNAGTDIKKVAISMTGDFADASQEDYVAFKQWDLCSKFGGAVKNPTCPDGKYTVYVKFYTVYGRSSGNALASSTITLKSSTTSVENLQQYTNFPLTNPFTKYLQYRQTNADIKHLQIFLNSDLDTKIAVSGAGSPGKETNYFGLLTYRAVIKFQEKYAKDILAPWGFVKGTGYVGKTTLAKINELIGNK